jgi:putative FmdB family regulatory protein
MPRYEFHCTGCAAGFTISRPIDARDDPAACPACGGAAERMLSLPTLAQHAARNADGSLAARPATAAPKRSSWFGHGHSHGPGTAPHSH